MPVRGDENPLFEKESAVCRMRRCKMWLSWFVRYDNGYERDEEQLALNATKSNEEKKSSKIGVKGNGSGGRDREVG